MVDGDGLEVGWGVRVWVDAEYEREWQSERERDERVLPMLLGWSVRP